MINSTCCRAHQASAGSRKSSGEQAIGVTRGGLNTKVHALCDALGNPVQFVLTPGQHHDGKVAADLLAGVPAKAYNTNEIVSLAEKNAMTVIISSKSNRKCPRPLDNDRYKTRYLVKNLFQRMKVLPPIHHSLRKARLQLPRYRSPRSHHEIAALNFRTAPNQIDGLVV